MTGPTERNYERPAPPSARPRIRRRSVLGLLLAGGVLRGLRPAAGAAGGPLLVRPIPATGETVPAVGLGTSDEFGIGTGEDRGPLREVLRRFAALGGTLVDTAPAYGTAEAVIGALVAELDLADRLFIATKVLTHGREAGKAQMARSRERLGKRPLDLHQVHSLVDVETQLANLREAKAAGRTRYVGITHSRVSAFGALEGWMRRERLDFVQLNYSFLEPDAERVLLPLAADRGMAVVVNRPFLNGAMFRRFRGVPLPGWATDLGCESWAQVSLKYILSHPAVTCVIPATSNPRHLTDNMGAGRGPLPDAATRRRIRELAAGV